MLVHIIESAKAHHAITTKAFIIPEPWPRSVDWTAVFYDDFKPPLLTLLPPPPLALLTIPPAHPPLQACADSEVSGGHSGLDGSWSHIGRALQFQGKILSNGKVPWRLG